MQHIEIGVLLRQAGACQTRLGAKAGGPQLLESTAVSRRRLSFFAQLKRPVQVQWSFILPAIQ